jgi:hypothetical protein
VPLLCIFLSLEMSRNALMFSNGRLAEESAVLAAELTHTLVADLVPRVGPTMLQSME